MKKWILLISILAFGLPGWAKTRIEKPKGKHPTAFAIIVDEVTYEKTKAAIEAYRDALEADGLATYIVSDHWESPDQVRKELQGLYKRKPLLEGVVFIGDIPVALIRNAQHMTTAFKMDEEAFSMQESSVPSDRFYDDLHLTFDFICRDSVHPQHFYYRLREDSPQQLKPTFYSGRIKYPEERGGDKYEAIANYLRKVVREKQRENVLDCFTSFTGSNYNSQCLLAWMDERLALTENFPLAGKDCRTAKFLNYRMENYMKFQLFNELQRDELDVMLFHEHGAPDQQYICEGPAPAAISGYTKAIRSALYAEVRKEIRKGKSTPEEIIAYFSREYGLREHYFDQLNDPEVLKADSVARVNTGIVLEDLKSLRTNPRFVMFDACYNGSFHLPGYVAGYYIFNEGNTVVAQANSRNVLQDRWTIEMIGLLSQGVRIGQWNRQIVTLEGHIIGDPTFHFTPLAPNSIGVDIVIHPEEQVLWENYLASSYADVQSLALRMLADQDQGRKMSSRLLKVFRESPFNTVRLEALKLLSRYTNADFTEAIRLGLYDAYEAIRRNAAIYAGKCGDPHLVADVVKVWLNVPESERMNSLLKNAAYLFPAEKMVEALQAQQSGRQFVAEDVYAGKEQKIATYIRQLTDRKNNGMLRLSVVPERDEPVKKQIATIRNVRNFPYHFNVEAYLKILEDEQVIPEVRVNMAEALGWFNYSYRKEEIRKNLEELLRTKNQPQEVKLEIKQTINRLK